MQDSLPESAKTDRGWWSNDPGKPQSVMWLGRGWLVTPLLDRREVLFSRQQGDEWSRLDRRLNAADARKDGSSPAPLAPQSYLETAVAHENEELEKADDASLPVPEERTRASDPVCYCPICGKHLGTNQVGHRCAEQAYESLDAADEDAWDFEERLVHPFSAPRELDLNDRLILGMELLWSERRRTAEVT